MLKLNYIYLRSILSMLSSLLKLNLAYLNLMLKLNNTKPSQG